MTGADGTVLPEADAAEAALERRYRLLMWCYPGAYRQARGSELLDTLMEAATPGQRWPAGRQAWALLLGGLRARTGAAPSPSGRQLWLGATRLAVLLLLASAGATALVRAVDTVNDALTGWLPRNWLLVCLVVPVLVALALWAVAAGRPALALVSTAGATVVQQVVSHHQ